MQPALMGWTSKVVRVGTGGVGDMTRVVAQRPFSKWMISMTLALPSRSMKHCCSPTPSGVPGIVKPRAVVEESKGAHSAGWMSAHAAPGGWGSLTASWYLTVHVSASGPGMPVPLRLLSASPPLLESYHAYVIGRPAPRH